MGGIMQFNVKAMAVTIGLIGGLGLFCVTWWIILFDGASSEPTIIGLVYRGYEISALGSLIGLAWGLVDGAIGGAVFAWLYNLISRCFARN